MCVIFYISIYFCCCIKCLRFQANKYTKYFWCVIKIAIVISNKYRTQCNKIVLCMYIIIGQPIENTIAYKRQKGDRLLDFSVSFFFFFIHWRNLKCVYFYLFEALLHWNELRRRQQRLLRSRCEIFLLFFFFAFRSFYSLVLYVYVFMLVLWIFSTIRVKWKIIWKICWFWIKNPGNNIFFPSKCISREFNCNPNRRKKKRNEKKRYSLCAYIFEGARGVKWILVWNVLH